MASTGFLGAGDVYLEVYDNTAAAYKPIVGPYNTDKLQIKPNSDLKEQTSKGKSTYGQVTESVPLPKPAELEIELSQIDAKTLEMALLADSSAINTGSGTVTDEAVSGHIGGWSKLAHGNLASAGIVLTDTAGTTTYVKGVDYDINYRLGMLGVLKGGAITEGQSLKLDYAYNAATGTLLSGARQNQVRARIRMDGVNFADQLPVILTVHEAVLTPDSAFDFLANDFGKVSLKGRMKTPPGKTEPFTVELHDTV